MACGTGKTLVALWIAEDLGSERTLVLLPSLTLLSQTLREWTANASKPFDYLAVCSDETVAERDAMVSRTADLGLPVTTNPSAIESFLSRDGRLVVFATYQSSPRIAEASTLGAPAFDLVIADEAHRCTGPTGTEFTTVLDSSRIISPRRLFMTATPRLFSGRVKEVAGEADLEIASMDDEEKFGPVFHRLTFGEAIERGLLSDYGVLVIGVDQDTYERYVGRGEFVTPDGQRVTDARTLASHIGLAKAMHGYDLKRVISFHGRVKKAHAFSSSMPAVIDWMPADDRPDGDLWSEYISGEMPTGKRDALLHRFRTLEAGTRGLLSNARCLAEGVDVPAIDGVTFIDPRRSTIDIIQAVGRAIRRSPDKSLGVVVLPVFVSDDEDPQKVLEDSSFKPVWDVLKALRAHDEVLAEELDTLRRRLGKEKGVTVARPEKIKLDLPATVGEEFARAFDVRLVLQTTASWEFWFGLLERFVEREGHGRPSDSCIESGFQLGKWVRQQRSYYSRGELDPEQSRRLEDLPGWSWQVLDDQWEEGFAQLSQFAEREGHTRVRRFRPRTPHRLDLANWVRVQRYAYGTGRLDPERERRLSELPGWSWDVFESRWLDAYACLKRYAQRYGHARPPQRHSEGGFRLGHWVGVQRAQQMKGQLDPKRRHRLDKLPGWSWQVLDDQWEQGYAHLKRYAQREGHARVPKDHEEDGFRLGSWVGHQRQAHKKGKLDPDHQRRMEELPGWTWDAEVAWWEERYARLRRFVEREGHARPPSCHVEDGFRLGAWVSSLRIAYRRDKVTPEHRQRLEQLPGWAWYLRRTLGAGLHTPDAIRGKGGPRSGAS
jgi:superfamily II DNA or RNA helicase